MPTNPLKPRSTADAPCYECNGTGTHPHYVEGHSDGPRTDCPSCNGTGRISSPGPAAAPPAPSHPQREDRP